MLSRNIGNRLRERYQIIGGPRALAQLLDIPDTTRVSNTNEPRRLLRVTPSSPIRPGQVIEDPHGIRFLVGQHGFGYNYIHYKLYQVSETRVWSRDMDVVDPVTGLKKASSRQDLGTIHVALELRVSQTDSIGVPDDRNVAITNADLKLGDYLDNEVVTRVDHQLGLTVAEIR